MRLTQSVHRNLQQDPDGVATIFGNRVRTWTESVDRVARPAAGLTTLGIAPGDRVAILSANSDRYHEYLLATWWAGAVVNPVNIRWSPAEIAYSIEDSGTRVLFVDDLFSQLIPAIRTHAPRSPQSSTVVTPARARTSSPTNRCSTTASPRTPTVVATISPASSTPGAPRASPRE